jgi:hypothetical protein
MILHSGFILRSAGLNGGLVVGSVELTLLGSLLTGVELSTSLGLVFGKAVLSDSCFGFSISSDIFVGMIQVRLGTKRLV